MKFTKDFLMGITLLTAAMSFAMPSYAMERDSVLETISDSFEEMSATLSRYFSDNKDDIKNYTIKFGKKAGEIAADTADGIGKFAKDHQDEIAELAEKTGRTMSKAASDTTEAVGEFAKQHKGDFANMLESAGEQARRIASDTTNALGDH